MRLLNVKTLNFEEFIGEVGDGIPLYAILSHTWGTEEVSYSDYMNKQSLLKKGYDKIHGCCRLADSEGFRYAWIDTCCIDKSSSAELSEAINSMFQWYRDAGICYAYLNDVNSFEDPTTEGSSFARSRWFTRGWTLQGLLAPAEVVFLGSDWVEIGTKKSLRAAVSLITRISQDILDESQWTKYSVAQKMSWAAGRCTTRIEDEAYCLMGLFDVNMPLLYGEGRKAFLRLQQEILKQSDDQSIFAWSYPEEKHAHTQLSGLIAPSPSCFTDTSCIELLGHVYGEEYENPFQVVNRLVRVRIRLVDQVKAIRLQQLRSKPPFYNIVEIQQSGEKSKGGHSTPSSLSDLQREEVNNEDIPVIQVNQQLFVPKITIVDQDATTQSSLQVSEVSSGFHNRTLENVKLDPGLRHDAAIEASGIDSDTRGLRPGVDGPRGPESWRWYIYEPAMIVPLRCHIGGHRLGILLSRSSIKTEGRVLSRLHHPSIVATSAVRESRLTPLTTVYASVAIATNNLSLREAWEYDSLSWPEIRIASLLSAGYTVHEKCGLGWTLHHTRAALVQERRFKSEADMTDYAPFVLFYNISGNHETSSAFFVSIPAYHKDNLTCEIGVCIAGFAPFELWDYDLYAFDLVRERRVEVLLGNGQAAVAKYREGAGISFVNVSIETLSGNVAATPVPHDTAKTDWVNAKLFPMLRSLR